MSENLKLGLELVRLLDSPNVDISVFVRSLYENGLTFHYNDITLAVCYDRSTGDIKIFQGKYYNVFTLYPPKDEDVVKELEYDQVEVCAEYIRKTLKL